MSQSFLVSLFVQDSIGDRAKLGLMLSIVNTKVTVSFIKSCAQCSVCFFSLIPQNNHF